MTTIAAVLDDNTLRFWYQPWEMKSTNFKCKGCEESRKDPYQDHYPTELRCTLCAQGIAGAGVCLVCVGCNIVTHRVTFESDETQREIFRIIDGVPSLGYYNWRGEFIEPE